MNFLAKFVLKKYKKFRHYWFKKYVSPLLWPNDPAHLYPGKLRRFPELAEEFFAERRVLEESSPRRELSVEQFKDLIVDEESKRKVETVVYHYNQKMLNKKFCPTTVPYEEMEYILKECNSHHRVVKHLNYLFIREFDEWRHAKEDAKERAERHEKKLKEMSEFRVIGCFDDQNRLQYGYWRNTMFPKYYQKAVKRYYFNNLRRATMFGQKIVIDCSFDKEMQEYETQSVGRQMSKIYNTNRYDIREPFDLHFCNCDMNSRVMKNFFHYMHPIKESHHKYCLNIHRESYLDLFPGQRFIYLSPDARYVMEEFDHNAIYIMGSLVGKTCRLPLTKWKAVEEGIECYRLPIHRYVELKPNVKKVLSFQGVFKILLELKDHNDWQLAFERGIQEHKLKGDGVEDED